MSPSSSPPDLTFEEALKELEVIVRQLEGGQVSLEEAIKAYERGAVLKTYCDKLLKEARLKIDQIILDGNEAVSTSPLTLPE